MVALSESWYLQGSEEERRPGSAKDDGHRAHSQLRAAVQPAGTDDLPKFVFTD